MTKYQNAPACDFRSGAQSVGVENRLLNVLEWAGVWFLAVKFEECMNDSESPYTSIGASTRPQPSGSSNIGWAHDAVALIYPNLFNHVV